MICKECIYYKKTDKQYDRCTKHATQTKPDWRCSSGLKQDNRTMDEVVASIKAMEQANPGWMPDFGPDNVTESDKESQELLHDIESKVHGQHPVEADPIHGDRKNLLESTFGLSTPDMLGVYKIDKNCNLEDPVNHPAHYTDGGIETIDFIEAKKLPYHLGNAVKYISRAGKKNDTIEDLKKAVWYINRYVELLDKRGK